MNTHCMLVLSKNLTINPLTPYDYMTIIGTFIISRLSALPEVAKLTLSRLTAGTCAISPCPALLSQVTRAVGLLQAKADLFPNQLQGRMGTRWILGDFKRRGRRRSWGAGPLTSVNTLQGLPWSLNVQSSGPQP